MITLDHDILTLYCIFAKLLSNCQNGENNLTGGNLTRSTALSQTSSSQFNRDTLVQ